MRSVDEVLEKINEIESDTYFITFNNLICPEDAFLVLEITKEQESEALREYNKYLIRYQTLKWLLGEIDQLD